MNETRPSNEFVSIAFISLMSATIVATLITKSALVLLGGIAGTVVVAKLLVKGV